MVIVKHTRKSKKVKFCIEAATLHKPNQGMKIRSVYVTGS
jgi:hypothetical protein